MRLKLICTMAAVLFVVGCSGKGTSPQASTAATAVVPTAASPVATPTLGVLVSSSERLQEQGQLIPLKSVELGFNIDGIVARVLVSDGQQVQAGQLLATLGGQEQYAATVATAKRDVLTSQQALDKINRDAQVASANAHLTFVQASQTVSTSERALENLLKPGVTGAEQALADATLVYQTDAANLQLTNVGPLAQAVQTAKTALDIAAYAYNQVANSCQAGSCNTDERDRLFTTFQNAQSQLAASQLALQTALATGTDKANKDQQKVQAAQSTITALKGKPDPAKVLLAQVNFQVAQAAMADAEAKWKAVENGPDVDQVAAAQASLDNAKAAETAAEASLAGLELRAPISGTLANFKVAVGEYLAKGKSLGLVADLSGWVVQLDDVVQYDLGSISVGQPVQVTFDGLPDVHLPGHVSFISPYFNENLQDKSKSTFSVQVTLDKLAPRLQWGLTANVTF